MPIVNLSSLAFFNKQQTALLNDLVAVNRQLMPHIVATATGCRLEHALALLIHLYDRDLVDGFVVIYHSKHQDFYFSRQPLIDGFPKIGEVFCQVCEEVITNEKELLFDYEFVISDDVRFNI